MKNLYTKSKLLNKRNFEKLERAFEMAWSKDTAYPTIKKQWSEENKAYGQCAITALIIYDLFGGRMIYDKANFHIWNELPDGTQQDFSRKQFLDERIFRVFKYKSKNDIMFDEMGLITRIGERYKLLKEKFQDALKKLGVFLE